MLQVHISIFGSEYSISYKETS